MPVDMPSRDTQGEQRSHTVRDENGTEVFVYTLAAWRLAVEITGNAVYEWPKFNDGATGKRKGS